MSEPLTKKAKLDEGQPTEVEVEIKSRDFTAKQEEEAGILQFKAIVNDGSATNLRFLCELKEIFGTQLPKMPKEYIVRLVFDKKHKSVCAIKKINGSYKAIGGICYRPCADQRVGEIAFCAIKTEEQVRGYGTRLMNQTKHLAMSLDKIDHFLTYADNYAIGYFKKQGFHMQISLNPKRWVQYIKDYEGGTLMECYINPHINYLDIPSMIRRQRRTIEEKVSSMTTHHTVYPGLQQFKSGAKIVPIHEIPGVKEAGFTTESHLAGAAPLTERESSEAMLRQTLSEVLASSLKFQDSWPFREPVRPEDVPDYHTVIKDPVDLSLIQTRLEQGFYRTKELFLADMTLMCDNCKTYNPKESVYYDCAVNVQRFVEAEFRRLALL
mmetsp:Transcript_60321/g.142118  ORF Transcript_60321/g.142118 Transcript_60321/m.142118 type:complete len:381 (+) Transcript_60321:219-1361(+)|eukprot:CAMPEP_0177696706 /NCGR_PEP_ID=MMETSP0484_2-20121128/4121_1 /TAXON_ID=354590 /ORGANISM="Rhodomonas lens, Strain RHODO" /LENGTH=380 /DNA_ID=CAMNT_0019207691 /DNA_START=133 /DNA_END=1275 /DNA_ORIENTATION=-